MRPTAIRSVAIFATVSAVAFANAAGFAVRTDRFGYTGTVTRYNSLADAQSGINAVDTYTINNRDLALRVYDNFSQAGSDRTIIMGSWWYTTDSSGIAGYGNVRGNSGRGFLQMYDLGSLTVTNQFGTFGGFDGTYYTTFNLNVVGSSAGAGQYSRFWIDYQGGGADKVFYHTYSLNLTATGLQGVQNGYLIASNNHPTGVTGTFSGIFENVSTTYPVNNGFYVFDLTLDMENWAYDNRDNLTGQYSFTPSYFATVPGPAAALPFALGFLAARRRRRN